MIDFIESILNFMWRSCVKLLLIVGLEVINNFIGEVVEFFFKNIF